jgi:hypothetical protein
MESAFTVFDSTSMMDDNSNSSADNTSTSNYSPPQTPPTPNTMLNTTWTDFTDKQNDFAKQIFDTPIDERLTFPPLQQQPCQCTAHCANNHNSHNITATPLDTLSSEQWNAVSEIFHNVLESIGLINNNTQPIATTTPTSIENDMIMPVFTNSTTSASFFPRTTTQMSNGWNAPLNDVTTDYVVPSQPTAVPPPTPTSPIDFLPWNTHQSQFNGNPITNITNITNVLPTTSEHLSQINQQTNNILFTSTTNNDVCDLFDSNFNFL